MSGNIFLYKLFLLSVLIFCLCGCNKKYQPKQTGAIGENQPVTRGEVARMVALNQYSIEEINTMDRQIAFSDTNINEWYDKYINAAYSAKLIAGVDEEHFEPDGYLTLRQAQFLLNKLSKDGSVRLQYLEEDRDKPIPEDVWIQAFEKSMNKDLLKRETVNIYADSSQCKKLGNNLFVTDKGITYYEGYENISSDCKVTALMRGKDIVALVSVEPITEYSNLTVTDKSKDYVEVSLPSGTRRFKVGENDVVSGDKITIAVANEGYSIKK